MRKVIRFLTAIALVCMLVMGTLTASALDNTTYTYTVSVDDEWVRTQDAYIPAAIYAKDMGLSHPGDIFYIGGLLYISDTDNRRIAVFDIDKNTIEFFGGEELQAPDGLYVTADGKVFVADTEAEAVFVYDAQRKLIQTIGRPDNELFSDTSLYRPTAVAVSSVGNVFVVGDGAYEGIMQFDAKGEFFGYFAANRYKMSMTERFQEFILNETQKDELVVRTPRPIDNVDISEKDLIFSVTQSDDMNGVSYASTSDDTLKKHNMAGLNIFSKSGEMKEEWNFTDVAAGPFGNVFAVTQTGIINEYDEQGNLMFTFGGRAYDNDRNGLFTNATAIDIDPASGMLYVLDKERALVQVFYPTDFANLTHEAVAALKRGDYESSEDIWSGLLRLNGMSQIAHIGYGKALFYQQKYDEALYHFEIANDKAYYSDTMWELRNDFLGRSMTFILVGFVVLVAALCVLSAYRKKKKKFALEIGAVKKVANTPVTRFAHNTFYLKTMIRHPLDGYYYLRRGEQGSVGAATLLYFTAFAVYMLDMFARGYIFKVMDINKTNPASVVVMFWVPLVLWLIGNYLIGTINEGEGSIRQIYVSTAYAFAPYIILTPFLVIVSHALTLNEGFIISLGSLFVIAWTAVLIFMSVMEMQKYTFGETFKSVLLIFFFMIMVIVAIAIIYLLFGQIVSFVKEIFEEGIYRAAQ